MVQDEAPERVMPYDPEGRINRRTTGWYHDGKEYYRYFDSVSSLWLVLVQFEGGRATLEMWDDAKAEFVADEIPHFDDIQATLRYARAVYALSGLRPTQ